MERELEEGEREGSYGFWELDHHYDYYYYFYLCGYLII